MKVDLWLYAMIGMANASALGARSPRPEGAIGAAAADEYPQEEYPKEEYPKEEYPKEEYKEDDYPKEDYPKEDYPKEDYPKDDYPKDDYPKEDYPKDDYPKDDYPKDDYPKDDYPKDDYPKDDYPKDDYPKDDYPKDDYPKDDYPKDDYPKEDYPKDDYPKDDYKDDYKPDKSYPEYPDKTYPSTDYSKGKYYKDEYGSEYPKDKKPKAWKPKTHHPEFFSLKVDDKCVKPAEGVVQTDEEKAAAAEACKLEGYAIRLEKGIVVATPYNKWWDPKLPIWFVDDDTSAYTVSKKPLQIYVDNETGALRYAPVGWLPPNSISKSFYKLGNNPLGKVGPSPAYFAWPTTEGRANNLLSGPAWWFCPISYTGQYQVFISDYNFGKSGQGGVSKSECRKGSLAAVNANPWKSKSY